MMLVLIGRVDELTEVEGAVRVPEMGWREADEWIKAQKAEAMREKKTIILVTRRNVKTMTGVESGLPSYSIMRTVDYAFNLIKGRNNFKLTVEPPELPNILDFGQKE